MALVPRPFASASTVAAAPTMIVRSAPSSPTSVTPSGTMARERSCFVSEYVITPLSYVPGAA